MSWDNDSWRDGYDAWKLRSPYDEREEPECFHEDSEIDWEGRARCDKCGETWWATADEIRWQREQMIEYDRWCREQERREFWRRLTHPIRWPLFRLIEKVWPRKSCRVLYDEEIPF